MASISLTCPHCEKVLRPKVAPPEGKRVKCPGCGEAFLPEIDEEQAAVAIQSKAQNKTKVGSNGQFTNGKPKTKLAGEAPKKRAEEDEDDLPKSKKKKKPAQSNQLLFILLGVGAAGVLLFSLALCGVGAFVWPGFMLSKKEAQVAATTKTEAKENKDKEDKDKVAKVNKEDPPTKKDLLPPIANPIGRPLDVTLYVSPDSDVLLGAAPKLARSNFAGMEQMIRKQAKSGINNNKPMAPELENLLLNGDRLLIFGNTKNWDRTAALVVQSQASEIDKLKKSSLLMPVQNLGGHAGVYKATLEGLSKSVFKYVIFPSEQCMILTEMGEIEVIAMLDRAKKAVPINNPTLALSRSVDKSCAWVAMSPDTQQRQKIKTQLMQKGIPLALMPQSLVNAITALESVTTFTVALDADAQTFKLTANGNFTTPIDANKIKTAIDELLNKGRIELNQAKPQLDAMGAFQLASEILNGVNATAQGTTATASINLRTKAIEEIAKLAADAQQKIAMNPPPFPNPNPNPNPFPNPNPNPNPNPGGGKVSQTSFQVGALPAGRQSDNAIFLKQGTTVTITANSNVSRVGTDVDLHVLSGAAGENVIASDISIRAELGVQFLVPADGTYRVRIHNLGPGVANRTSVTIQQR